MEMETKKRLLFALFTFLPFTLQAQIGQYRNEFGVGVNGGVTLSSIDFVPEVPQDLLVGKTFGLTMRYTVEKYFNSICAIVGEVNYAQMGWQERIWDQNDSPVINPDTELPEEYLRRVNYIQVPLFARMGWGRERRGFQFFAQAGPQLGYYLNEEAEYNFDLDNPAWNQRVSHISGPDIVQDKKTYNFSNMYHKPIENKFDYGIAVGLGLEFSQPRIGHIMLEGRFYYGLGNVYGSSKRDYFAKSDYLTFYVKATYLFDIVRSKNDKIK